MEKASTQRNFHMPQYGQKMDIQADFDQMNNAEAVEEVVVTVDAKKQVQMDERRLFNWLCKRFPRCFNPKSKRPLKIGISDDIELMFKNENQTDVDQMALRRALRRYVGDQNYQRAILEHKARFDLKGNSVEAMTPEHLAHAEARLAELKEKAEFRKQGGTNLEFYEIKKKEKEEREAAEVALKAETEEVSQENEVSEPSEAVAADVKEPQVEETILKPQEKEAAKETSEVVLDAKEEIESETKKADAEKIEVETKAEEIKKTEDKQELDSVEDEAKDKNKEAK